MHLAVNPLDGKSFFAALDHSSLVNLLVSSCNATGSGHSVVATPREAVTAIPNQVQRQQAGAEAQLTAYLRLKRTACSADGSRSSLTISKK